MIVQVQHVGDHYIIEGHKIRYQAFDIIGAPDEAKILWSKVLMTTDEWRKYYNGAECFEADYSDGEPQFITPTEKAYNRVYGAIRGDGRRYTDAALKAGDDFVEAIFEFADAWNALNEAWGRCTGLRGGDMGDGIDLTDEILGKEDEDDSFPWEMIKLDFAETGYIYSWRDGAQKRIEARLNMLRGGCPGRGKHDLYVEEVTTKRLTVDHLDEENGVYMTDNDHEPATTQVLKCHNCDLSKDGVEVQVG